MVPALEERDEQARREGIAGSCAVDGIDPRGLRARDLLPVLEQQRSLGAERHRHEPVAPLQQLELVAVHDRQVGVDVDRPRRGGVQAEETGRLLPRADDGGVRHLELAEHGVALGQLESAELRVRARSDDDLVLAGRIDEDHRHACRRRDPGRPNVESFLARQRLLGEGVVPDGAHEAHVGPEPRAGDGLVRALPAGHALERRAGHGLPRPGQLARPARRGRG